LLRDGTWLAPIDLRQTSLPAQMQVAIPLAIRLKVEYRRLGPVSQDFALLIFTSTVITFHVRTVHA